MAKQEMCREITAEQEYQEEYLADRYQVSGNPEYVRRAKVMQKTFEARIPSSAKDNVGTLAQGLERTVFEA